MYQRELKIQKGLKNKVQLQFKNSDQKNIRIKQASVVSQPVSTSSNTIIVQDAKGIQVGMIVNTSSVQAGTYVSAIDGNTVTVSNLDLVYNPEVDQFLSPIISSISSGTSITFNHNFMFSMFDQTNQRLIIEKGLEIVDDGQTTSTRGLALLSLTENDTRNIESGYYHFGITLRDNDGAKLPSYANTYYGIQGTIELSHDLYPTLKDSLTINSFQMYVNRYTARYDFYTGNLRTYPELTQTTTIAAYFNDFSGTVKVQATLEDSPSTFANYATLETKTYQNFTGIDYFNAEGSWSDVRLIWIPDESNLPNGYNYYSPAMPGNPTPGTAYYPNGKIDKVLVRS